MSPDSKRSQYTLMCFLFVITIAAQFVSLAFGRADNSQSFISMILPSFIFLSVLTLPSCWSGVVLGERVGLGAPLIKSLLLRKPDAFKKLKRDIVISVVLGLLIGGFLLGLRVVCAPYLPPELPAFGFRGVIGGFAVSLGAAVAEEIWFRLGLMTLLVWLFSHFNEDRMPSPILLWIVIVMTSAAFGAAHLPQLISFGAGSMYAISATVIGNVLVGILYGWCYWRRSLFSAIVAHFSVDLVLHVLPALFS